MTDHPLTDEVIARFWPDMDNPDGRADIRRQYDELKKATRTRLDQRPEREIIAYAYSDEHMKRTAPVQGYPAGIPWPIHLEAYQAYCDKYHGGQTALIDLDGRGCRGGFHTSELDDFVPGWRDRVSYVGKLETRVTTAERLLQQTVDAIKTGRSEPLYIMRDAIANHLEDIKS